MYKLIGLTTENQEIICDDKISDEFATTHSAEYCGQYFRHYQGHEFQSFRLERIPDEQPAEAS